jgi:hypothetical protein
MLQDCSVKVFFRTREKFGDVKKFLEIDFFPVLESLRQVMPGLGLISFDFFWILKKIFANEQDLNVGLLRQPDFMA